VHTEERCNFGGFEAGVDDESVRCEPAREIAPTAAPCDSQFIGNYIAYFSYDPQNLFDRDRSDSGSGFRIVSPLSTVGFLEQHTLEVVWWPGVTESHFSQVVRVSAMASVPGEEVV
jgi:hypothetical protein